MSDRELLEMARSYVLAATNAESYVQRKRAHLTLQRIDAALAAAPVTPVTAEPVAPTAYVPVHPRQGPLWSDTFDAKRDVSEARPRSYPLMALYAAAPPVAPSSSDSLGACPSGTACSGPTAPEPKVSALRVPPAGAEVVPRYEDNEVVAWDVWVGRQEVRAGVWTGDFVDTFDNESDAIDLVGSINAAARGMEAPEGGETRQGLDPEGATARPEGTRPTPTATQGAVATAQERRLLRLLVRVVDAAPASGWSNPDAIDEARAAIDAALRGEAGR